MLVNLNRYEEALQSYDRALEFKPDYHEAWYLKALIYSQLNNFDLAIENLAQAIKLNPEYREMAKTESIFDNIREEPKFRDLIDD